MRALDERGYAVSSAATGMAGLSEVVDRRPDLVVLDLGLPDVDGTEVLAMIRAVSQVPIIIASARDDEPSLLRALDSGADDDVIKPFTAAQLVRRSFPTSWSSATWRSMCVHAGQPSTGRRSS